MKFKYRGFTLIELLVVIALLGILSAIGITSYQGYTWAAKKKDAELSLNSILLANEEYASDNGEYKYVMAITDTSYQEIQNELLDGKETLPSDDWKFGVQGNIPNQTLNIVAKHKTKKCKLTLTEKMKLIPNGSDC
tara:strand:+ start:10 stop:417 length:408 start_codon:yes stop_codon:yes gene_type:complete